MGNSPGNLTDPSGGGIFDGLGDFLSNGFNRSFVSGLVGAGVGGIIAASNHGNIFEGAALGFGGGAVAGFAAGYIPWSGIGNAFGDAGKWLGGFLDEPKNILLIYGGADFFSTEETVSATMLKIKDDVIKYGNDNHKRIITKTLNTRPDLEVRREGEDFLKKKARKKDKIIIYGYSLGGVAATSTADLAVDDDIDIDLLITVDAALGQFSGRLQIPNNVKININYYQSNPSTFPLSSHGYPSQLQPGNRRTNIQQHNWTNKTSGQGRDAHSTIDEDTLPEVINIINGSLL